MRALAYIIVPGVYVTIFEHDRIIGAPHVILKIYKVYPYTIGYIYFKNCMGSAYGGDLEYRANIKKKAFIG